MGRITDSCTGGNGYSSRSGMVLIVSAWAIREYGGAIVRGRLEHCAVCGRFRPMIYRRRVVPRRLEELWGLSGRLARALARKESSDCTHCGAQLRTRRIAQVILETYLARQSAITSPVAGRLGKFSTRPEFAHRRDQQDRRLTRATQKPSRVASLRLRACAAPGGVVGGVRSEDLTRLTYPDESFDLVLTSETLEHVPELTAALAEIHRVLRPGGRHIFTIPLLPGVLRTFARTVVRPDGTHEQRAPQIRHPGGDVGISCLHRVRCRFSGNPRRRGLRGDRAFWANHRR